MGDFVKRIKNAYKLQRYKGFRRSKIDKHIETFEWENNCIMGGGLIIQVMGGGKYTILDNSVFKKIHFYLICIRNGGAVEEF